MKGQLGFYSNAFGYIFQQLPYLWKVQFLTVGPFYNDGTVVDTLGGIDGCFEHP